MAEDLMATTQFGYEWQHDGPNGWRWWATMRDGTRQVGTANTAQEARDALRDASGYVLPVHPATAEANAGIWTVYNGWMGNGPMAAIVEAPDEAAAIEAAIPVLRDSPDGQRHGEKFYERERLRPERLEIPCVTEIE